MIIDKEKAVVNFINTFLTFLQDKLGFTINQPIIVKATQLINGYLINTLNTDKRIDDKLRQHIIYVMNNVLVMIKNNELSHSEAREAGKQLLRLYRVYQAYKAKTDEKIFNEISDIVRDFHDVFNGG